MTFRREWRDSFLRQRVRVGADCVCVCVCVGVLRLGYVINEREEMGEEVA